MNKATAIPCMSAILALVLLSPICAGTSANADNDPSSLIREIKDRRAGRGTYITYIDHEKSVYIPFVMHERLKLDREDFELISRIPGLEKIVISSHDLTRDALAPLAGNDSLKSLILQGCEVNDEHLDDVRRIPSLEVLNILGSRLTERGATRIQDMESLKWIYIDQRLGACVIEQLKEALPNARVIPQ